MKLYYAFNKRTQAPMKVNNEPLYMSSKPFLEKCLKEKDANAMFVYEIREYDTDKGGKNVKP